MPTAETMRIMLMMKMMIMFTLCFLTFGFLWCQFFFMKFRLCFSPPAPIFAPAASFTTKHSLTPTLPFSPFVIIMIMTMMNDKNDRRNSGGTLRQKDSNSKTAAAATAEATVEAQEQQQDQ